jgi:hypothetical protein
MQNPHPKYLWNHFEFWEQCCLNINRAGCQWLMPVILATQEAEISRTVGRSQPTQIVQKTLSHTHTKKGVVEWLKMEGLRSSPSTTKTTTKTPVGILEEFSLFYSILFQLPTSVSMGLSSFSLIISSFGIMYRMLCNNQHDCTVT